MLVSAWTVRVRKSMAKVLPLHSGRFVFKQKTASEITRCLEFRRVLFRSGRQGIEALAIAEDVLGAAEAQRVADEGLRVDRHQRLHPDGNESAQGAVAARRVLGLAYG